MIINLLDSLNKLKTLRLIIREILIFYLNFKTYFILQIRIQERILIIFIIFKLRLNRLLKNIFINELNFFIFLKTIFFLNELLIWVYH
jgi:hypothetical protein